MAAARGLLVDMLGYCLPCCAGSKQAPLVISSVYGCSGGYGSDDDDEEDDDASGSAKQQQERHTRDESRKAGAEMRADEKQMGQLPSTNADDLVRGPKVAEEEAVDYD